MYKLKTTRDASLGTRMGSLFEDGHGDEGPVAKGCCIFLFIGILAIAALPEILVVWFLIHLFS